MARQGLDPQVQGSSRWGPPVGPVQPADRFPRAVGRSPGSGPPSISAATSRAASSAEGRPVQVRPGQQLLHPGAPRDPLGLRDPAAHAGRATLDPGPGTDP